MNTQNTRMVPGRDGQPEKADSEFQALPESWITDAVFEMRMADIPGVRIGSILAEAEGCVVASGQHAYEVLGDPVEFGRGYAFARDFRLGREVKGVVAAALRRCAMWSLRAAAEPSRFSGPFALCGPCVAAFPAVHGRESRHNHSEMR